MVTDIEDGEMVGVGHVALRRSPTDELHRNLARDGRVDETQHTWFTAKASVVGPRNNPEVF